MKLKEGKSLDFLRLPRAVPMVILMLLLLAAALSPAQAEQPAARKEDSPRHLIYLHGRIVQDQQNPRPRHPQFGVYELEGIREAFAARGFLVSAEIRPKAATVSESADRVVEQVRALLEAGVPADHITVVGGSMGMAIGLLASVRLQNPELRFAVLGGCLSASVESLRTEEGAAPKGRILSIREESDETTAGCSSWEAKKDSPPGLTVKEIVLHTGQRHGFLYRPLPEWVEPVAQWAKSGG